ncbi:MAG: bifunctional methylenetetrahydrofolate dehydrogenase/methenyltetrahydrofolate cyclohydrolase FolD [Candidatus Euphemobacter frigidus]|nr:bifunctional methylenetetrahydrofolate dehydrogenase/methenyltetrahydrofolate cyclohydrolase FolD [Candidatus Euphemobacter frigidus]MDP8276509.1 bifunctional methylenetetrahydrofolate dehydrogenase/methenyltetrahydrofolate cyclohydrolase FolD [Candidatus Euphemobacter frigidus]
MTEIIDGKEFAREIREEVRREVELLKEQTGSVPGLAVVMVGENPASEVYVRMKEKACQNAGIASFQHRLSIETGEEELLDLIGNLNQDPGVSGILIQLPLPDRIDEGKILCAVSPAKDVDGFHPANVGRLMLGEETFLPCTPLGILELLHRSGHPPRGKHVVVVGRSNIVGKPIAMMLVQKKEEANATVTICHTGTPDLAALTRQADILIVSAGRPGTITAGMVKEGVVVIDVGVNEVGRNPEGKRILVGDVDFPGVREKAGAITPVPGGVGPMTIAMLLKNTLRAYKLQIGLTPSVSTKNFPEEKF